MFSNKAIIAASILGVSNLFLVNKLRKLEKYGVKYLHFDVMDGKFVPNTSFDDKKLKKLAHKTKMVKDVHLMIENPSDYIKKYAAAGADIITVHYEAFDDEEHLINCLKLIRSLSCKAGVSIKPNTKADVLNKLFPYLDLVLVMSVEPGFGGQKFIDSSLIKIVKLRQKIVESRYDIKIEVDGGINSSNAVDIIGAGADIIVAGSAIFKNNELEENVKTLCNGLDIS